MKITLLSCLFIFLIQTRQYAAVRTVNNNGIAGSAQYTTFDAAVTASLAGDTIYVGGSGIGYGTHAISKRLVIIGTGFSPDKQNPITCNFTTITFGSGSDNSKIIGISFLNSIDISSNNLIFESLKFGFYLRQQVFTTLNITLNKCVFLYTAISTNTSSTVSATFNNCILNSYIVTNGTSATLSGSVNNCLFLGNNLSTLISPSSGTISNIGFMNCIFYGTTPSGGINVSYTNCLSYLCPTNTFGGTINIGNLTNINPLFTNYPLSPGFHSTDNYNLQAASPAHNYGTDGKDLGVYGGADGANFHMGGDPAIPQMRQVTVPSSVTLGGSININVISTRKN